MPSRFIANSSGANTRADANGTIKFLDKRPGDKVPDAVVDELEDRGFVIISSVDDTRLISRLNDLETNTGREIASVSGRVDALEAETPTNAELQALVTALEQTVSALEASVESLQTRVTTLEANP